MAAPAGITWGDTKGSYGRIGIYTKLTNTTDKSTVNVEVWFWSKYSINDSYNTFYFDNLASSGSATTSKGALTVKTTVDTGSGWSTSNQVKLASYTFTYTRGTSDVTRYLYAKLENIDRVGSTMYVSKSIKIPKKDTYTVSYNANGGSGAPSPQTKTYGITLKLRPDIPTRTGYTFKGWATSASGNVAYAAGANYTANDPVILYAVWESIKYTVSYNANGGSGAPSAQTKTYGITLKLRPDIPTRTGYTFKGWATSASAITSGYSPGGNYNANSDVILYAVWSSSYTSPTISGLTVSRCDQNKTANAEGTYALVNFSWATSVQPKSIVINWGTSQQSVSVGSSTNGTVNALIGNGELSTENTYTVRVTVTDVSEGFVTRTRSINSSIFSIDVYKNGKGVSFGKSADIENLADFGWMTKHRRGLHVPQSAVLYSDDVDGNLSNAFEPYNVNGDLLIGYGYYVNKSNRYTTLAGHDLLLAVSNIPTPGAYRPYYRHGDSMNVTVRTAGYVTNGKQDVTFMVPISIPIIGTPTVTASSIGGFALRQGDKYTHGSSASASVMPDSYTALLASRNGVYITARFSDTTNVTNNDTIGVYWSGNITFS